MHFEGPFQNRLDWAMASLDLSSIARGFVVLDAIVKHATVKIESARAVSSGRFLILFSGAIAHVEESYKVALETAGEVNIDHAMITNPHPEIMRASERSGHRSQQSVLIAEFCTVSSTLLSADAVLKACDVWLGSMTLAEGIGAKGFFSMHGSLCDIEASRSAIQSSVREDRLISLEIIANPHLEIGGFF